MENFLSAEKLVKEFTSRHSSRRKTSVRALDSVSFTFTRGARIAIVGASGSGKSTLATCLACLERPDSGAIQFEGRDLTLLPEDELRHVRPQIQLVFQDPATAFNPSFTVQEVLEEPLVLQKKRFSEKMTSLENLLSRVGLSPDMKPRKTAELSGGQRQRLAIARALMLAPKILILDEALSALDYSVQAQIANLLLDLNDDSIPLEARPAIIFITHDLIMAARFAGQILVMENGRIVESGPTRKLIGNPEHSATRALLASTGTLSTHSETGSLA